MKQRGVTGAGLEKRGGKTGRKGKTPWGQTLHGNHSQGSKKAKTGQGPG